MSPPVHLFSVDVEEHFQVSLFESVVPTSAWGGQPSRVRANTGRILDLLDGHATKGTFFVVGWVADRDPDLVREIAARGHELASHSWWHRRVTSLTPAAFRRELAESKDVLEQAAGVAVLGFRAPSFSIVPGLDWAFDCLLEAGYRWDSSVFPIRRPGYGWPGAPRHPYWIERPAGRLLEIPMATVRVAGLNIPAAGGGYLRQFPYGVIRAAFGDAGRRGVPGMFYVHPWEVDPDQPRVDGLGMIARFRHYRGLDRTLGLLDRMLGEFRFGPVRDYLAGTAPWD